MIELSASRDVPAGKAFIWSVITDFDNYRLWHPFALVSGVAFEGEKITYSFNVISEKFGDYGVPGRIQSSSPLNKICWTYGLSRILFVEEWFSTATIPAGTRIEHGMRFKGAIASLFPKRVISQMRPMLEASVEALARHVTAPGNFSLRRRISGSRRGARARIKRHRADIGGT